MWTGVEGVTFLLTPREEEHGLPRNVLEVSEVKVKSCQSHTNIENRLGSLGLPDANLHIRDG